MLATHGPTWRCPTVLFMLPPSSARAVDRITAQDWPPALRVEMLSESFGGTSAVWNALLGVWNRARTVPRWEVTGSDPLRELDFPIKVADFDGPAGPAREQGVDAAQVPAAGAADEPIDPQRAASALHALLSLDGLYGCAVADAGTGKLVAQQTCDARQVDLDQAAAVTARLLDAHRAAAQEMSLPEVEEVTVSAGSCMQIVRTIAQRPGLFMLVVMDRGRTNLGMVRLRMAEAQKTLV